MRLARRSVRAGAQALTWALTEAAAHRIVGIIAGLVMHFGFSAAAEGLRLQGDNAGTPPLLGLSFRAEALGHLVVPLVASGGSALLVTAVAAWASDVASALVTVGWMAVMVAIVTGTTMASAFRGSAPEGVFLPQTGPATLIFWVSRQAFAAAAGGGALAASVSRMDPVLAVVVAACMAAGSIMWGFSRLKAVTLEHRV